MWAGRRCWDRPVGGDRTPSSSRYTPPLVGCSLFPAGISSSLAAGAGAAPENPIGAPGEGTRFFGGPWTTWRRGWHEGPACCARPATDGGWAGLGDSCDRAASWTRSSGSGGIGLSESEPSVPPRLIQQLGIPLRAGNPSRAQLPSSFSPPLAPHQPPVSSIPSATDPSPAALPPATQVFRGGEDPQL